MHLKKIHGSEDTSCTKTFIFTEFAATRCHPVLWEDPSSIPGKQETMPGFKLCGNLVFPPIDTDLLYALCYTSLYHDVFRQAELTLKIFTSCFLNSSAAFKPYYCAGIKWGEA